MFLIREIGKMENKMEMVYLLQKMEVKGKLNGIMEYLLDGFYYYFFFYFLFYFFYFLIIYSFIFLLILLK
jgi:hypothetical protein